MTNRESGCGYIEDARIILTEAEASLEHDTFAPFLDCRLGHGFQTALPHQV